MTWGSVQTVARALLYEGYLLYPYRRTGLKNQKRWTFGTLYPPMLAARMSERSSLTVEVLVRGDLAAVRVGASFLQWAERTDPGCEPWLEGVERLVETQLARMEVFECEPLTFPIARLAETWTRDASQYACGRLDGTLAVRACSVTDGVWKLTVSLSNELAVEAIADDQRAADLGSFVSAHLLLACEEGTFVSLLDPPAELALAARGCAHEGVWPVLVGDARRSDRMLASPIHLYDFPAVAPESPGDFFDATEMDEMLALRIQTLTDHEKGEARRTDPRARALIDRTEAMSDEERLLLHGARRDAPFAIPGPGERVRLRPRPGRDVLDIALTGEMATVVSIEEDVEGRRYCTVVVDADPGRDLGWSGQPGHRFFFDPDELERLS